MQTTMNTSLAQHNTQYSTGSGTPPTDGDDLPTEGEGKSPSGAVPRKELPVEVRQWVLLQRAVATSHNW